MLELEEAVERILAAVPKPITERCSLAQAHRRIVTERVSAPIDLPAFDNSSVDGYAVRAADVAAANANAPARLRVIGRIGAGDVFDAELLAGTSVRLFTGAPVPRGADAVVMQEDTRVESERPDEVSILDAVKPWENVRFRGEDVKAGAWLVGPGEPLTVGRIALLSATGLGEVAVSRRPVVGVLATGSELREPGQRLAPGEIYESNRSMLALLIHNAGGVSKIFPLVPDELAITRVSLERAFAECDAVVTCGGVSVGEMDFVKTAFEQLGGSLQFWKVAIKPGRPFVFGQLGEKYLFGLPGNPISALVTFLLLVRPALLRWQGAADFALASYPGKLAEPLSNQGARRHFMRVTMDASGNVRPAGIQASHILSSTAASNGLVDVSPQTTLAAGSAVQVLRWEV
jgi:molybdopterin molybdotransferase